MPFEKGSPNPAKTSHIFWVLTKVSQRRNITLCESKAFHFSRSEKFHCAKHNFTRAQREFHCNFACEIAHGGVKVSTGILRYDKRVELSNLLNCSKLKK